MKSQKITFVALALLAAALAPAAASIGISLSAHSWNVTSGGAMASGTWTSPSFTVQNTGNETARLSLRASDTQNWTLATASGLNTFAMQFGDGSNWISLVKTNTTASPSLNAGSNYNFFLRFMSPSDLSDRTLSTTQVSTITISVESTSLTTPPTTYVYLRSWGTVGSGFGQIDHPSYNTVDADGNYLVTDAYNNRVVKFSPDGTMLSTFGGPGSGDGQFNSPRGIVVDSDGNIYVCEALNNRIQKFTSAGVFIKKWGAQGTANGQLYQPHGMSIDSSNNIYVAEYYGHRVSKFDSDGNFLMTFGSQGSGDGNLYYPFSCAVDDSGNVYVTDTANRRIEEFAPNGTFMTKWGSQGTGDGQFNMPSCVMIGTGGYIYVSDSDGAYPTAGQTRVEVFTPSGTFYTKFGSWGTGNGQFQGLYGLALDHSGNVVCVDCNNTKIQVFAPQY